MELDARFVKVIDRMDRNFSMKLGESQVAEYWDYFVVGKGWTVSDFVSAVESCIEELQFKPKIADIIERRPKKYRTIEDIDKANGLIGGRIEHLTEPREIVLDITSPRLKRICEKLIGSYPKDAYVRHPRHACPECSDKGVIEVYDPRTTYHAARAKTLTGDRIRSIMVGCQCEAGQVHREERKTDKKRKPMRPLIAFDEKQMCRVSAPTTAEQIEEITDFMQDWNPRNYNAEFADWG